MSLVIILGLLFAEAACSFQGRANGQILQRDVILTPAEFTEARVLALAREFCQSSTAEGKIARLAIYVDATDARIMSGKGYIPVQYDSWVRQYAAVGRRGLPMAQVVVSAAGAVVRISDGKHESKRVVLRGDDPLSVGGNGGDIIHLRLYDGIPLESGTWARKQGCEVFVRTLRLPDESGAKALSRLVASRLGLEFAYVHMRTDVWFIEHPFFPVDYRFEDSAPPSRNEYMASTTYSCYVEGDVASCTLRRPVP